MNRLTRALLAALLGLALAPGGGWALTHSTPAQVASDPGGHGGGGG